MTLACIHFSSSAARLCARLKNAKNVQVNCTEELLALDPNVPLQDVLRKTDQWIVEEKSTFIIAQDKGTCIKLLHTHKENNDHTNVLPFMLDYETGIP